VGISASTASAASLGGFAIAGPLYPMSNGTPFEQMLGLHGSGDDKNWGRSHVRTPGWAVLAPTQATLAKGKPGRRVELTRLAHATLLTATTRDPFAMKDDDLEAIERFVIVPRPVDVFGVARLSVRGQRQAADDDELDACCEKCFEESSPVGGECGASEYAKRAIERRMPPRHSRVARPYRGGARARVRPLAELLAHPP